MATNPAAFAFSRCYSPPPLNSTSAASLASSSRTIGMRPTMSCQIVRAEPMSTLDAELNDFGAQLAMLGGYPADRDG
jgi:hypothetical protein